jgi:beta-phosphoglucomutase family hydrolase
MQDLINRYSAFLFDLNGTMIDDMSFHVKAWGDIINNDLGAGLTREQLTREMYGKNEELLIRIFGEQRFTLEEMQELSMEKERRYQAAYKPHLKLIEGLPELLESAHASGKKMGIGSAAIMFNINFILDNLGIRKYFDAIVSADHVTISKPDPETFLSCAGQLGVDANNCLVFEDAPKGVEAAANAGMDCIVLTTLHTRDHFEAYSNIVKFITDYRDLL